MKGTEHRAHRGKSYTLQQKHNSARNQGRRPSSRRESRPDAVFGCTSHFLNSDATATLTEIEGKICCPRCA